jgi:hypothetical protein
MLDYRHLGRGLSGADALRRYHARTGMTGRGNRIWSEEETDTLRRLYPDYKAAMKALPGRSYYAIRAEARSSGIARRRHVWTTAELACLKKMAAAGASNKEMFAAFPGFTQHQVIGKLAHRKIRRKRRPFKVTGYPLIDSIRERCHRLGWSMVDLDAIARTRRYFTTQAWSTNGYISTAPVAKAVEVLGGALTVTWKD